MAVQWTEEQKKVIELRNRSILVSAAAGSGKTAVLVQRILGRLTDPEHPIDIDRMLIMTFTRAAAGEMKERLAKELEKTLYEHPDNEHLQRQMSLIHTAQITTIDGFCAYVLRNYFHLIDLDPGYRIADEGELKLLKQDVLEDLLEDSYAQQDESFQEFVEVFCTGKDDKELKELILKLYETSMSDPYPEQWLARCLDGFAAQEADGVLSYPWFDKLWELAERILLAAESNLTEAKGICQASPEPIYYEEAVDSDLLQVTHLAESLWEKNYEKIYNDLQTLAYARLSSKKTNAEERLKKQVKDLRENAKNLVAKELKEKLFAFSLTELREIMSYGYEPLTVLVSLTREFGKRFDAKKREKNLLDFGDMEHMTLKILGSLDEEGNFVPSKAARELSEKYEEVMVDEYQDSNQVQEIITQWVSGWAKDQKNIFMVGDVKQSIYRFRQAKPELFMDKYHRFTEEDSEEQRIDLHRNFRSRAEVLSSVNYLFRQLMGEDLGGITYDEAAALHPGASFPEKPASDSPEESEQKEALSAEVLLIDKENPEYEETDDVQELEALAIAQRIHELVGRELVFDRDKNAYRPAEYGDIAVLLRSFSGWGETIYEVLTAHGIPAYAASRTGYFGTTEIMTILNYLQVVDNPRQDLPLAGVLSSPMGACTAEELAVLRSGYPEGLLWDSVQSFLAGEPSQYEAAPELQESLREKLTHFTGELTSIRRLTAYTPVHQLILEVLNRTGYGRYARALPDGAQRSANLLMLVEKAMEYEKTSYRGLFNFVRYMEQLQKYEVDFGEVNLSGAGQGVVQIMTIHKSKGLEFPIVIAAGMGKQFNLQDLKGTMLVHPGMGVAMDAVLPEERLKIASPHKQILRQQLLEENLGEELRVLYVALTRAKEKLILTGTLVNVEKRLSSLASCGERSQELLPYYLRSSAKCYWDWILPALMGHRGMDSLCEKYGILYHRNELLRSDSSEFEVRILGPEEFTPKEIAIQTEAELQKEHLMSWDPEKVYDEKIRKEIAERFSFRYPAPWLRTIPGKISVSDLKKKNYHVPAELSENILANAGEELTEVGEEVTGAVPRFMRAEEEEHYTGAKRGTAYHRVMECLDYGHSETEEMLKEQLRQLVESDRLSEAEAECVEIADLQKFLQSPLGERMKRAALDGRLHREQPFMMLRNSEELDPAWHAGVGVLVQGIVDAYFMEDGEIVLVDYKTDHVNAAQRLLTLYHVQLEDYAFALERMTGRRVKEIYLYSFTLEQSIPVPWK